MGEFSLTHWLILGLVLLLLFGAKRIPEVGASLGKGIREFKRSVSGIADAASDDETRAAPRVDSNPAAPESRQPKRLVE